MALTVAELAKRLSAEVVGAPESVDREITSVQPLVTAGESDVEALANAGDVITYRALRDGEMRVKHSDVTGFELSEITLPLPGREVKVGDSWQSRIQVWPDPLKAGPVERGPLFLPWVRRRAGVIHDFIFEARSVVKSIRPEAAFGNCVEE